MNDIAHHDPRYFKKYGKTFQEKIFQAFLTDNSWTLQMVEIMIPGFFEIGYLKFLTEKYFSYQEKYKTFPTLPVLINIVKESLRENRDAVLRDQVIDFLHRMRSNPDTGDLAYVKEQTLDFCKRQAFKEALEKAVQDIDEGKFDIVVDDLIDEFKSSCSTLYI